MTSDDHPVHSGRRWPRRRFLSAMGGAGLLGLGTPALSSTSAARRPDGLLASGRPSMTAQGAAELRAAHQLIDDPPVLDDPLALRIIGAQAFHRLRHELDRHRASTMRLSIAMRSRYAEDQLALRTRSGVNQYVLLGAGLDTFACRNPHRGLRVFEVDHPATQAWKRARLAEAQITPPRSLVFTPVDFEVQTLGEGLAKAAFRPQQPAFFSMLGVAVYISRDALRETLRHVATLAPGSALVVSYSLPAHRLSPALQAARADAERRVAESGEPWISHYEPREIAALARTAGFRRTTDFGPAQATSTYLANRADGLRLAWGERVLLAEV